MTPSIVDRIADLFHSCDPRLYQIASLGTLLAYGLLGLNFDVSVLQIGLTFGTALLVQYAGARLCRLPAFDPLSAVVSAVGLCIFLRTNHPAVAALAAGIAIGSKFTIRWRKKHIFNPTNLALLVIMTSGLGWISPGQWGQTVWLGFLIACLGSLVVSRAVRADVTLSVLGFYLGLLILRALWLGDPLTIPLHQIESGTLLIFSFFMITDPKTTPDSRPGRLLFTFLVAVTALYVQFVLFRPHGPLWALLVCSPLVPVIDRYLRGSRYDWSKPSSGDLSAPLFVPCTFPAPTIRTKEDFMSRQDDGLCHQGCPRMSEHYRRSEASAESWPRRKAGTDHSTTVARPWLREFQKGAAVLCRVFRSAKAGRIAPGGMASQPRATAFLDIRLYVLTLSFLVTLLPWNGTASAFCGFYVAKADSKLFNKASEVAIARSEDKTVITMANDFKGDVKEFAMVVPVPTVLEKGQIHVGDAAVIKHLSDYSAPRLVEYFDNDPCRLVYPESRTMDMIAKSGAPARAEREKALGVTVEAQYTVGEYDIIILSANESAGLETWLTENGYRIPKGASSVLHSYIKQNLKFFVAKVNLGEQAKLGLTHLRPLQIAFESPRFMLPIRLGTVNADGPQELFLYFLTKQGRVETTNYRTVRLPEAQEIPLYVKDRFGDFYRDMFAQQVTREQHRGVFLEYAWDMTWCDPCAADPLSAAELRNLGVFWLNENGRTGKGPGRQQNVFLTRLHVRYDAAHFPEDLSFQETSDRGNFQARYILRHPWNGQEDCAAAVAYREQLYGRYERQAETLATLTGWNINDIRKAMNLTGRPAQESRKWYERLWSE